MMSPSRRMIARTVTTALIFIGVVGPWPARDAPYTGSTYFRDTVARIPLSPGKPAAELLRVGAARIDITPAVPVPVAGFIGQILEPYSGVNAPCSAQAITIAGATSSVTILGADLLLIDDRLARAIVARTGLPRDQVYFTATHTHGGPGGWGIIPLERLVAGTYRARGVRPAGRAAGRGRPGVASPAPTRRAGLHPDGGPGDAAEPDPRRASRPTTPCPPGSSGPPIPPAPDRRRQAWRRSCRLAPTPRSPTRSRPARGRLSGRPRGGLADAGRRGVVLFAAGTVGDASPVRLPASNQQQSVEAYAASPRRPPGSPVRPAAHFESSIHLVNRRSRRISSRPRSGPVPGGIAPLQPAAPPGGSAVRGPTSTPSGSAPRCWRVFPGIMRATWAEGWSRPCRSWRPASTAITKDTSSQQRPFSQHACYETRVMSFFGPDLGSYLNALAQRSLDRIAAGP